jgi:Tol biopolymer transport system component
MIGRLALLSLLVASTISAQAPHEPWRTITTPHFRVHYPAQYEAWATRAAARLESVRTAIVSEVGFAPETVTDVLIENPIAEPNGLTISLLDTPRIVLYSEPPDPEDQIGEYSDWIDLLTVHETAHLVHLLRPSRNPYERALAHVIPLDPITLHAPRWVLEGYATVIEGRVTGSGRPSSAMRAAILRTWATNGQLPTYGQLNSDHRFLGMSMAYLAGSAFLEWLVEKSGPDSLKHLWARMTATQRRSFDTAFTGVFGDSPLRLYGRFTAEVTANAMTLARSGDWREGQLWQETTRGSGDPAVSPDGKQLVMVLRNDKGESKLVVYSTGVNEEEAKSEKRIAEMLQRDPEDVAPVRIKPLARKPLDSFVPSDGGNIENPRWTRDGTSIIYTHSQPDHDGFLHHDLFRWTPAANGNRPDGDGTPASSPAGLAASPPPLAPDFGRRDGAQPAGETPALRKLAPTLPSRITRLADVKDADPIDATHAVAIRTRFGESQIVMVDLTTGEVTARTPPSLDVVYAHPRAGADGRIAWAEHSGGEWHVAVDEKPLPFAGAFAPEWGPNGALFAAVADRGFIDIARLDLAISPAYVTRSAGMDLNPAPSPDGSLYFMSLDPEGFNVRRIPDITAVAPPLPNFDRSLVPAIPPPPATPIVLHDEPVTSRPYGIGRQEWFAIFGGQYTPYGSTEEFALRLGDVLGRLDTLVLGATGDRQMPRGAAIATVYHGLPIDLGAHVFDSRDTRGVELRATRNSVFPLANILISGGGLFAQHCNRAFLEIRASTHQQRLAAERIAINIDSANHLQATARAVVHAGGLTLGASVTEGRHVSLGGIASSIEPDSLLIERILDPAFDRDTLTASTYRGERLFIVASGLTFFWQRHHLVDDVDLFGVETSASIPAMPLIKTPALQLIAGVAQLRAGRKVRGWVGVRWRP